MYTLLSDCTILFHCTAGTDQSITATHDSFLLYSEDAKEAQSWILAISRVMNEVCIHNVQQLCYYYFIYVYYTCTHEYCGVLSTAIDNVHHNNYYVTGPAKIDYVST